MKKRSNYYYNWGFLKNRVRHFWLKSQCALMTHFGVYPLVFSFSTWTGQGFYVELFFDLAPLIAMTAFKGVPPQKLQALPELLALVSC